MRTRAVILAFTLAVLLSVHAGAQTTQPATSQPAPTDTETETLRTEGPLTDREIAFHVLNRLAFGPRPGQVDEVLEIGWKEWVEQQFKVVEIDDRKVEEHIRDKYPSLRMSMDEIFNTYRPRYEYPLTREQQAEVLRRRGEVATELREAVVYRAVHSNRQLVEVLAEFWRNHFNVDNSKDDVAYLAAHFEEQVIRKHMFGHFGEMLLASAKHPAMLIYLDNAVSQAPLSAAEQRMVERYEGRDNIPRSVEALQRHRGLNENYARELLELHTLGVDNGYTQDDVTSLARLLTGWSVGRTDRHGRAAEDGSYGFYFREGVHDFGEKRILSVRIPRTGGLGWGERVIASLSIHPNTADFISWKLCRYLVNDNPSPEMVARVSREFRRTKGDLSRVYAAIITDPEFISRDNFRAKFKTPFEFTVSSIRAADGSVKDAAPIERQLRAMGQAVYQCEDPTGYYDQAEAWLDPGVLVHRWEFALRLSAGQINGVELPEYQDDSARSAMFASRDPDKIKAALMREILPGGIDEQTDTSISAVLERHRSNPRLREMVLGLILGSPTFQQQ